MGYATKEQLEQMNKEKTYCNTCGDEIPRERHPVNASNDMMCWYCQQQTKQKGEDNE